MKGKKDDKAFRELFRHELENAEVMPSSSAGSDLMRRLAVKEFFHFIPSKFNVWYACGVAAAGAAIALALFPGPDKEGDKLLINPSSVINTIISDPEDAEAGSIVAQENDITGIQESVPEKGIPVPAQISGARSSGRTSMDLRQTSPSRTATDIYRYRELFNENLGEKDRLKGVKQLRNIIQASVSEGCSPLKVRFTSIAPSYESFRWVFGDGGYSEEKEPEWIFDFPGEYEVSLGLYNSGILKAVTSSKIIVHPVPVARFEIVTADELQPEENVTFYNYSTSAERFKWIFGDGSTSEIYEPVHSYKKAGSYSVTLVAISEYGCHDTLIIENAFNKDKYFIEFPNAFIPNPEGPSNGYYSAKSDESARVFHPEADAVSEYQLKIFSKMGLLIFESNDINIGWDGYYNGQLCEPGVYIWKVRGIFINREPFTKMGDVTLLRDMK